MKKKAKIDIVWTDTISRFAFFLLTFGLLAFVVIELVIHYKGLGAILGLLLMITIKTRSPRVTYKKDVEEMFNE